MEEHWEPQHSNDSHPGLLSDDGARQGNHFVSTTMADFSLPRMNPHPTARRTEMLRTFYWKQFSRKFFDELGKMPVEEDNFANFTTTYHDEFNIEDFKPKDILDLADPEHMAKYPLYSDPPYSVYMEKIDRIKPSAKARNPLYAFRKNSTFVRKWYDELE